MKKRFIVLITLSLTLFIGSISHTAVAQNSTKTEALTPDDQKYTGPMTEQDFVTSYTKGWFKKGYQDYNPSHKTVKKIKRKIKKYTIKAFIGTWCPDSKRETPKLFKLLDKAKFNMDNLTVYTVDHRKNTAANYEEGLNIDRVPTIIFYNKNGEEVNRFVEHPVESIEEDILKIVNKEGYINHEALKHQK